MANNLRKYNSSYKILRNVSAPVMIFGFPLMLALIYFASLFLPLMLIIILKVAGANMLKAILIPALLGIVGIIGVKKFYKKYGINGFFLQQKDLSLPSDILGDQSVQQILQNKMKK